MDSKEYHAYLASDEWKKKRTRIRRRARKWCERCKVRPYSDIHHLTYANVGNERLEDLIAVCSSCHAFLHGLSEHDPAAIELSESEIKIARELTNYWIVGAYIGIKQLCDNHPEFAAVGRKLRYY